MGLSEIPSVSERSGFHHGSPARSNAVSILRTRRRRGGEQASDLGALLRSMGLMRNAAYFGCTVLFSCLASCRRDEGPRQPTDDAPRQRPPADASESTSASAARGNAGARAGADPVLLVADRDELEPLAAPLDFGGLLFDAAGWSTKRLRTRAAYRSLVEDWGSGFPQWWVGHPRTHWTLVGVVNRLDRRDQFPGTCGETRLLYRLEHRDGDTVRRLPVAFNVVFQQRDDGVQCRDVARSWLRAPGESVTALTEIGRPLHADALRRHNLVAIEVNARSDRDHVTEPSVNALWIRRYHPDTHRFSDGALPFEVSGYFYKGLGFDGVVRALTSVQVLESLREGTPPPLESNLNDWTRFVAHTDEPTLFERSWSHSDLKPAVTPFASPEALAHRIDTLTCSGCHRRRSVAGFHLPGDGDGLRGGASAHLLSELPWRRAYVAAVAAGKVPERTRKVVNAGPEGENQICSLPGSPLPDLGCPEPYECRAQQGFEFGACLAAGDLPAGPCTSDDPSCLGPDPWFPAGFSSRACEGGHPCQPLPRAEDLARCLGAADPWACALARAQPARVDDCADQADCRDGLACVEAPGTDRGVCLPEAATPQLRTFGHASVIR